MSTLTVWSLGEEADVGLEAIELVGDLLPRHAGAALVEQRGDEAGDRVLALQRRHVAEAQAQPCLHDWPRVPLGSSATLRPLSRTKRWVRASRLAGVGSNDSACTALGSPW